MVIQEVERWAQGNQWIDEGQRDPDDERKILVPQRLPGFLPELAASE